MAVKWSKNPRLLENRLRAMPGELHEQVSALMGETADEGADMMRQFIKTRGTGWNGHTGRVETGNMLDSVSSNVSESGKTVFAQWGWLDPTAQEKYFGYQENGFTIQTKSGRHDVTPMHALLDSELKMREKLRAALRKVRLTK